MSLKRVTGFEPVIPTWKDGVLPLHHTRKAGKEGFEPPTNALEVRGSIQLSYLPVLSYYNIPFSSISVESPLRNSTLFSHVC